MTRVSRWCTLAGITAALLGLTVPASAATGWTVITPPGSTAGAELTGSYALSDTDAWAVGGPASASAAPVALNWNGTAWSSVPTPTPSGSTPNWTLKSVAASSASDAWAVGEQAAGTKIHDSLYEHWNGTAWSVVPTPNFSVTPGSGSILNSVAAISSTDAWAVGQGLDNDTNQLVALVEHWNGTKWAQVPTPTPLGEVQWLTGVSADGPSDIWAVGVDDTSVQEATLTIHFDGSKPTIVPSPNPINGNSQNDLSAVTVISPTDAWAVGTENNVNNQNFRFPLILHWTGTAWSQVSAPNPGSEGTGTFGVAALSAGDVWAVGETYQAQVGAPFTTYAAQWNGTQWTQVTTPNGPNPTGISNLSAITALPDGELWAVGTATPAKGCCERVLTAHDPAG